MAPPQPLLQILNKKNRLFLLPLLLLSLSATVSSAYSVPKPAPPVAVVPSSSSSATTTTPSSSSGRRAFLSNLAIASSATFLTTLGNNPANANAAAEQQLQDVYFGAGCFWHVQHEFVEAERSLLQRKDGELTSRTGYAGGFKTDGEGRVSHREYCC